MKKQRSLKVNFVMNTILTMSSFVFPLITFPYVSRKLLAEGVGKVSFSVSVISFFLMIAQLGIPTYGVRACAQVRDDKDELFKTVYEIFFISLIMTIISYIVLFLVIFSIPKFRSDKILYLIISLNIIFSTIGMEWFFKALEQYTYIAVRSIAFKIIALVATLILIHDPKDYYVYAILTIFATSASSILNFFRVRKHLKHQKNFNYNFQRHVKSIFVFFAMSCATTIYTNLDSVMLGLMTTDVDVGYYATSIKIKSVLASIVSSLGVALLPRVSYYISKRMNAEFQTITKKAINFVFLVACPLIIYFILYSKECIRFLAGRGFDYSIVPMQILMPTLLFIGLTNIMGIQILVPFGLEKKVLYSEIVGAIVDLIFNLIFIPIYGVIGAAVGTLLAEISVFVFQIIVLKNIVKDCFGSIGYFKLIFALTVSALVSVGVKSLTIGNFITLLISAIIFFVLYILILVILREKLLIELIGPYLVKLKNCVKF